MTPKRLPQAPPERPKTETNRSTSAPKVSRSTFRFWGVRVIPTMFSPRAQKRRAQRPGGSFWAPRGRPRFFRGARGGRFGTRKRAKSRPGPSLGACADAGPTLGRFGVDLGSIWGSILEPFWIYLGCILGRFWIHLKNFPCLSFPLCHLLGRPWNVQ